MKPNKLLWLQGGLYTTIAALTPVAAALMSDVTLTTRYLVALVLSSLIAGATALKAFLSTNFAESPAGTREPQPVTVENTPENPVPTDQQ